MPFSIPPDEMVGCLAGLLCLSSSIPQIRLMLTGHVNRASHSLLRNAMLACGNAVWIVYAVMNGNVVPVVMCFIGVLLNAWICILLVRPHGNQPSIPLSHNEAE